MERADQGLRAQRLSDIRRKIVKKPLKNASNINKEIEVCIYRISLTQGRLLLTIFKEEEEEEEEEACGRGRVI
ncbi:hypothetical protein OS493_022111 [Desmophyllum pertusum]|uniref:Uncharacterized protein n=1 Tax=Desmophyllum pertusum TaxID=174260 RepID=A0A9W9YMD1_9CNID|nr:hypothetical protein OS493_022111 [Desmophyllum pertusum]